MPKHFIFSQRLADILYDAATHDLVDVMKVKKHLEVEKSGNPVFRNGKLQFNLNWRFHAHVSHHMLVLFVFENKCRRCWLVSLTIFLPNKSGTDLVHTSFETFHSRCIAAF